MSKNEWPLFFQRRANGTGKLERIATQGEPDRHQWRGRAAGKRDHFFKKKGLKVRAGCFDKTSKGNETQMAGNKQYSTATENPQEAASSDTTPPQDQSSKKTAVNRQGCHRTTRPFNIHGGISWH
ncbi:MAG: hypothetical protein RBT36_02680 [Desulfobulbus sp.]|nr:hypothetical protein [Desulfobulbus sp.]